MHIKRLVIKGFKSYLSLTDLEEFSPHYNAVVGRNGACSGVAGSPLHMLEPLTRLVQVPARATSSRVRVAVLAPKRNARCRGPERRWLQCPGPRWVWPAAPHCRARGRSHLAPVFFSFPFLRALLRSARRGQCGGGCVLSARGRGISHCIVASTAVCAQR